MGVQSIPVGPHEEHANWERGGDYDEPTPSPSFSSKHSEGGKWVEHVHC